ncbi:MAG: Y+L amino acid transporter [Geoglossum simile]|nr:MAG: Y+L amino acid transporter [Geoglossum simile]
MATRGLSPGGSPIRLESLTGRTNQGDDRSENSDDDSDGDHTMAGTMPPDSQRQGLPSSHRLLTDPPDLSPVSSPSPPSLQLPPTSPPLKTSLTYFNCLSLVLGIQIGSGIFSTPSVVSAHVLNPTAGILTWLLCGLLVWAGAASFIELGTRVPLNGGMQEYLRAGWGDVAGFLFLWVWLGVVRPASIAVIAMIFAEHVQRALGVGDYWVLRKAIALGGVAGITAINCLGVKSGAKAAGSFLVLKIGMIFSIVSAGVVVGVREKGGYFFGAEPSGVRLVRRAEVGTESVWKGAGEYVTAGFAALWVYGGWEALGFIAGEMHNPARDLPRVLNSAMLIAIISFTLTASALYTVLPFPTVRDTDTPVVTFGTALYGPLGALTYTVGISLSALGSLNSNIFAIGRLACAAARRAYIPAVFAGDNSLGMSVAEEGRWLRARMKDQGLPEWIVGITTGLARVTGTKRLKEGVPIYSMLLTALLTTFYIMMGTFRDLLTFIGIVEYFVFILVVLSLFRLRRHPPSSLLHSPTFVDFNPPATVYRTHTLNPVVFCVLSAFLVVRGVLVEPKQGAAVVVMLGVGWGVWLWKERKGGGASGRARMRRSADL